MFCVKCSAENKETGKFCRKCGAPLRKSKSPANDTPAQAQQVASAAKPVQATPSTETTGLQPNVAGLLCYILGWLSGVVFLFIGKKNSFVRFHSWQSIITFAILSIFIIILNAITLEGGFLLGILKILYWIIIALAIFLWLFLMFKAYKGQTFKLPLVGSLAQKFSKS